MKKIILLIILCMLAVFVFAADVNLNVAYYNNTNESHVCLLGNMQCAYNNLIKIPVEYSVPNCSTFGAVSVLVLSDPTNAHVDSGTITTHNFVRPDLNVCMGANTFTSGSVGGACYFTWKPTCDTQAGYNCMFGLSDIGNAHLSACNTFSPEYKFCCKFPNNQPICPQMNLTTDKRDYTFGQMIRFDYNCPAGLIDTNVWMDANNFFRTDANQCGPTQKSFDINSAQLNMETLNPKTFAAQMFTKDGSCRSGWVNFNVTIPTPGGIITPVERCKIKSISADPLSLDSNTLVDVNISIQYACHNNGVTETLLVFDPNGIMLHTNSSVICNTTTQIYSKFQISSSSAEGIYRVRIADANCMKDSFFAVTKSRSSNTSNIPDTNLIPVIALLALVVLIVSIRKKRE